MLGKQFGPPVPWRPVHRRFVFIPRRRVYVSRFIRSALFPILIVIIVAMFIQYVISNNNNKGNAQAKPIYSAPGTAGLSVLTSDLKAVKTKADATETDLADLGERARQFQLRVLVARAREAHDAALHSDFKNLLQRLDDVEGGK